MNTLLLVHVSLPVLWIAWKVTWSKGRSLTKKDAESNGLPCCRHRISLSLNFSGNIRKWNWESHGSSLSFYGAPFHPTASDSTWPPNPQRQAHQNPHCFDASCCWWHPSPPRAGSCLCLAELRPAAFAGWLIAFPIVYCDNAQYIG